MFGYAMLAGGAPKEIDTGFVALTTAVDTGVGEVGTDSAWGSVDNGLRVLDGGYGSILWPESALTNHDSSWVNLTDLGFDLPLDAFDITYEAEITGYRGGTAAHNVAMQLLINGGATGSEMTKTLPQSTPSTQIGSLTPAAPLTAADVNHANFGVRIQGRINNVIPSGGASSLIDAVRLRLKYKTYS